MKIRKNVLTLNRPLGGDEELEALKEVIDSGWWGIGPKVEELETKFAEMIGSKYAVAVTSNTAGQDLVLKAADVKNCDVINPTISFVTTAVVPLWNDCTSNIVDVQKRTLNIDPDDVKKSLKRNTKAIIAVNMAGIPADIDDIRNFYDDIIIEDCALSLYVPGAGLKGDLAVWSFQAVKTISCGDGGMITTNNKELYKKLRLLRNFGIDRTTYDRASKSNQGYLWDFEVKTIGYKAYMNDIQAAICLAQLKKLNKYLEIRRNIQKRYNSELNNFVEVPKWSENVQWYSVRVQKEHRNKLISHLASKNIHTAVHWKPLHLHPIFKQDRNYPVADLEWLKLISLPCHPQMTDSDIDYVIYWIKNYFNNQG